MSNAQHTTLDLEGSRLYAIGFGFFPHDYFPSLILTRLLARPADGADHHGASLVPGYSSRTTSACFLRQRLWWVPVDALSMARGCLSGPGHPPATDRENGCCFLRVRERCSAQCAHFPSGWASVSRIGSLGASSGPRSGADLRAARWVGLAAYGHGLHKEGSARVVSRR